MTDAGANSVAPDNIMFQVLALREEADRLASRLNRNEQGVFGALSLPLPRLLPAELGFIKVVSWLFVLYHEVGKVGARFLSERISVYCSGDCSDLVAHLDLVAKLRTYSQHNLDSQKPHDRGVQDGCERWFEGICGSRVPGTEDQWQRCLTGLLRAAAAFLSALVAVLRGIETDGSRDAIIDEWVMKLERFHPPQQFDELIIVVCREMGRDAIDPVTLRRRFYDKWTAELHLLGPKYDFSVEARKLIEHALLTATVLVLPITGADVMRRFDIPPGPQVGSLLERARRLYDEKPCSAKELLERLSTACFEKPIEISVLP